MGRAQPLRLLLDTHAWLWSAGPTNRLSENAKAALGNAENALYLSPVSVWETLMLARKRKLVLKPSPAEFVVQALRESPTTSFPVDHEIAMRSEPLAGFGSNDPADRLLVATALEHDLVLVTADRAMRAYEPLKTLW